MSVTVGFFGKLPAHADFVRRGLPAAVTTRLDDWLQAEFGRSDDPAALIADLAPVRFASSAVADAELALGTMITSRDRVGRSYLVMALRLSAHPSGVLPEPLPAAWDDWCGRAEALLLAARSGEWTADATQTALETAARATNVALIVAAPFALPENLEPATVSWHAAPDAQDKRVARAEGLPRGAEFDRFIAAAEND